MVLKFMLDIGPKFRLPIVYCGDFCRSETVYKDNKNMLQIQKIWTAIDRETNTGVNYYVKYCVLEELV